MPVYVVVMPVGETGEVKSWCESLSSPAMQDEWDDLAITLIQENLGAKRLQVDVFLCLYGPLEEIYNYSRLAEVLRSAREHAWGSPIHLVIGINFRLQPEQWRYQATWLKFFEVLNQGRVVDLIEYPALFDSQTLPTGSILRVLADADSERRKRLESLFTGRSWKCVVRPQTDAPLADFLKPFVTQSRPAEMRGNRIIVCNNSRQSTSRSFITKNVAHHTSDKTVVANLVADTNFHRWLTDECERKHLELFEFSGALELRFVLMRLNQFDQYSSVIDRLESVQVKSNPIFNTVRTDPPCLLITNAFDPTNAGDYMLCLEAADEAGELKHGSPNGTLVEIYQSISCDRFPSMLEAQILTAWVYQGHGDHANGLQESRAGKLAPPNRWRECFSDYHGSLPLVVFSACRSSYLARLFAEEGAGVAIGFDSDVTSSAAKLLTSDVVSTALRTGGDQKEILNAFRRGCRRLIARGYINSGPRAFYANWSQAN